MLADRCPAGCRNYLVLSFLFVLFVVGCERAPVETEDPAPTFGEIQANIFNESCARSGCHGGESPAMDLDLSEGRAYENLVNVPSEEVPALDRVEPGSPDSSYLVIKLEGGERMAEGTARMPFGAEPLSEERIASVRQWIEDGALNN